MKTRRVKFITSISGASYNYNPKDEVDIEEGLAKKFIANGIALPVPETIKKSTSQKPTIKRKKK